MSAFVIAGLSQRRVESWDWLGYLPLWNGMEKRYIEKVDLLSACRGLYIIPNVCLEFQPKNHPFRY